MANVNKEAIDVADDLEDKAPNDAVRKLARKIKEDDKTHEERAKQLRNVLN